MRRLKPKKTNIIKIFNIEHIGLVVVLFTLLALCMLSRPAIFGSIKIELPKGKAEVILVKQEPIIVTIRKDETVYVNDKEVKSSALSREILELANDDLDAKIFVKADKELKYDTIVKIISVINRRGFSDVSFMIDISKDL